MSYTPDFSFLDDPQFGLPNFYGEDLPLGPIPDHMQQHPATFEAETRNEIISDGLCIRLPSVGPSIVPQLKASSEKAKLEKYAKGTTTLAFKFKEGVMVCVDARASMGSFIGSNKVRKVIEINDYLLGTMAGGAADCMYWERVLTARCKLYELQHNEKLTVRGASKVLLNLVAGRQGLSMGTMVAGCDIGSGTTDLFFVDDDGMRIQGDMFSIGSGSPYAYGVMDSGYKYDMTLDQAVDLGMRAIVNATHRDSASGGVVRVYYIHKSGWRIIHDAVDASNLYKKYYGDKQL